MGAAAVLLATQVGVASSVADTGSAIVSSSDCSASTLPSNDDGSTSPVQLPFSVNFYGQTYSSLWVNNNGNVTFDAPLSTFTPFGLQSTQTPIIAPFFADVDTRGAGSSPVQYGYGQTTFQGRQAFCVDWVNVGYFGLHVDKLNSFQLLLVDRSDQGSGAFDIVFNYGQIQWETGDASGGVGGMGGSPARAGFSSGTNQTGTSTEFSGSGVSGSFLDSSSTGLVHGDLGSPILGRYVFGVRSNGVVADKYLALGDSYQSGEGAFNYESGTDVTGVNQCHRSANAYPNLLVDSHFVKLQLDFRACSGATIADMLVANASGHAPWNDGIAQVNALGVDTRLVTVGIVGNDLEFSKTVHDCVVKSATSILPGGYFWSSCQQDLGPTVSSNLRSLQSGQIHKNLLDLYRLIRAKAPYARVVVVSYPHFFPKNGFTNNLSGCGGIARASDQQWMNSMIDLADQAIGQTAQQAGFGYVNMADSNAGHEQCTSQPAMNSLVGTDLLHIQSESFHPNQLGHQLMANKIETFLGYGVDPSFVILPNQNVQKTFTVEGKRFVVNIAWPGSDVETTLISPSGKEYTRDTPQEALHDHGATWEYYDITDPEPGEWTVQTYGLDVAEVGEPVTLTTSDETVNNQLPIAVAHSSGSAPTLAFDASASSDPDGTVTSYFWDFGDGTTSTAVSPTHTYTASGIYRATLIVTDNAGDEGFGASDTTVVVPGSSNSDTGITVVSSGSLTVSNQLQVPEGNIVTGGNFDCSGDVVIAGSVFVTGNVHLTTRCHIKGDVNAGGNVVMDATPVVDGSVSSGGSFTFQSTAKIGDSVRAAGTFAVSDGVSWPTLLSSGAVGGTIQDGVPVPSISVPSYQPYVADPLPTSAITWKQWMNATAAANNASSGSQGLSSSPGCTMAPWSSSVNGSTATTMGDLVVDARQAASACSGVQLQQMTLALRGDLTLIVGKFDAINGLNVISQDGAAHTLTIKIEGTSVPGKNITFSPATQVDPQVKVVLQTPGVVTINGTSSMNATVRSGSVATSGTVTFG